MKEELFEMFGRESSLSAEIIFSRLLGASVIACFIFLSYRISHEGSIYSKKFNVSLVVLTVATTTSLGMVGALSIVRFRTAVKDVRDTVYIFWTIVTGICCGAGDYLVAAVGSAFVFTLLLLFGKIKNDGRVLMIIRGARANEEKVQALIFQYYSARATLRVKNTTETSVEFIYELNRKLIGQQGKTGKSITDEIYAIGGIEYFNIVTQNEDISS